MINFFRYLLISTFFLFFVFAQDRSSEDIQRNIDAENSKLKKLKEDIALTARRISKIEKDESQEEAYLAELEKKLQLQQQLINTLTNEERYYSEHIAHTQKSIEEREYLQAKLRSQVIQHMRSSYRRGRPHLLELLLLADNWSDFVYRLKYQNSVSNLEHDLLQQYAENLQQLRFEQADYESKLVAKKTLRREKEREINQLEKDRRIRNDKILKIRGERSAAKTQLADAQKAASELESKLSQLFKDREQSLRREEELRRRRAMQQMATTGNFKAIKGSMLWPAEGRIVSDFGRQRNRELNTVTENIGVEIATHSGSDVVSVLDGMVSQLTYVRGFGHVVVIDHGGGYSTVYGNLQDISLKENEYVSAQQAIGKADTLGRIAFLIFHDETPENPIDWLAPR